MNLPPTLLAHLEQAQAPLASIPGLFELYRTCFASTYETTAKLLPGGEAFVVTGDIPAMWLRDSSTQVRHYLPFAKRDAQLQALLEGLIARQVKYICIDPYANAFNEEPDGNRWDEDETFLTPWTWERKYETDSLCYPVWLAWSYWKATGRAQVFTPQWREAARKILETLRTEQNHRERSAYRFIRPWAVEQGNARETLQNGGLGTPVAYTGMTWSGFRPSDDACAYHYLIPANCFAAVILGYLAEIAQAVWQDTGFASDALRTRQEIVRGIEAYGIVHHPRFGRIYAYEADGLGHFRIMDDANVPSLLSLPYLGYLAPDDPVYQNTRAWLLSEENPCYFRGKAACGVGSEHTVKGNVWPISLAMQGLTAANPAEKEQMIRLLLDTTAGCGRMHESFDAGDPAQFTRPWFAWADSLCAELIYETYLKGTNDQGGNGNGLF